MNRYNVYDEWRGLFSDGCFQYAHAGVINMHAGTVIYINRVGYLTTAIRGF